MDNLIVKDYMNREIQSIPSSMFISEVIEKLVQNHMGGAPVVNEQNEIIGFVSEHDCISKILQSSYYCDPDALVSDVMTTEIETLQPADSIIALAQKMLASKRQVFPVVESNKLIGIINRSMVLAALKDNLIECQRF